MYHSHLMSSSQLKRAQVCAYTTLGVRLHCILFSANDSSSFQEISDSPKILMLDAHVKKNCTNISISISDDDDDDVFIISISLQSISGLYSGISLLSNEARVVVEDDTGEYYEQLMHRV